MKIDLNFRAHLSKTGVTGVTGVTDAEESSNGGGSSAGRSVTPADSTRCDRCDPAPIHDESHDFPEQNQPVTPVTPREGVRCDRNNPLFPEQDQKVKKSVTPVTPVTPENDIGSPRNSTRMHVFPLPQEAVARLLHRYGEHLTVEVETQRFDVQTHDVLRHAARDDEQDLAQLSVMIAFCRRLVEAGAVEAFALPPLSSSPLFVWPGRLIRCADCRHHRRTDHPRLVACAAGESSTNPTGMFWDSDHRCCARFERIT